MPNPRKTAYLHLVPIEPNECLSSWILRIANRDNPNFRHFSKKWLGDELRVTPGFDAFPSATLLMQIGAINSEQLDYYITHHTLLGTTKCFYTESEWKTLINTHGADGSRIYTLRRKSKQRSWHLCRTCRRLEHDRGVAIWPVVPQIPGMLFCHKHSEQLEMHTATRIPPYDAPSESDLFPMVDHGAVVRIGSEKDHLQLARDISKALKFGLSCRHSSHSFRDTLSMSLFGRAWSGNVEIWRRLKEHFGEPFLDVVQVRGYHLGQSNLGEFYPSFHGIVYLAVLARAFGTNLRDLLVLSNRAS